MLLLKMAKTLLVVISALVALCAADEGVFYSEKYIPKSVHVPSPNIFNGSYFPKLDHFRPQDTRTATFVSLIFFSDQATTHHIPESQNPLTLNLDEKMYVEVGRPGSISVNLIFRYFRTFHILPNFLYFSFSKEIFR